MAASTASSFGLKRRMTACQTQCRVMDPEVVRVQELVQEIRSNLIWSFDQIRVSHSHGNCHTQARRRVVINNETSNLRHTSQPICVILGRSGPVPFRLRFL